MTALRRCSQLPGHAQHVIFATRHAVNSLVCSHRIMGNRVCRLLQLALLLATLLALIGASPSNSSSASASSSSSRAVSYLREEPKHISHLLQRKKRWLIFELGSSLTVSTSCVFHFVHFMCIHCLRTHRSRATVPRLCWTPFPRDFWCSARQLPFIRRLDPLMIGCRAGNTSRSHHRRHHHHLHHHLHRRRHHRRYPHPQYLSCPLLQLLQHLPFRPLYIHSNPTLCPTVQPIPCRISTSPIRKVCPPYWAAANPMCIVAVPRRSCSRMRMATTIAGRRLQCVVCVASCRRTELICWIRARVRMPCSSICSSCCPNCKLA